MGCLAEELCHSACRKVLDRCPSSRQRRLYPDSIRYDPGLEVLSSLPIVSKGIPRELGRLCCMVNPSNKRGLIQNGNYCYLCRYNQATIDQVTLAMLKHISLPFLALALFACISCGEKPIDIPQNIIEEDYSIYGALAPVVKAFKEDESISLKSNSPVYSGNVQKYQALTGIKNKHLYGVILDVEKEQVVTTWTGQETISTSYQVNMGYGEYQTKELESVWVESYTKTPGGSVISWRLSPIGWKVYFVKDGVEKSVELFGGHHWNKAYIEGNSSVLIYPSGASMPLCYSYSGEKLFDVKGTLFFPEEGFQGAYAFPSQEEVLEVVINKASPKISLNVRKTNMKTGDTAELQKTYEVTSWSGNPPKISCSMTSSDNKTWTITTVITEYSGEKTTKTFKVDSTTMKEID